MIVDRIPKVVAAQRTEVQRFVRMIDAFYEMRVKLFASADAEPEMLFTDVDTRDAFDLERTVSRLIEMRSTAYLGLPHGDGRARREGIVDT